MSLRVVIVDDEALVRRSIRRFLRDHDVEMIEDCSDGLSALEAIHTRSPNLVFMDLQMPEMMGMDVIEALGEERIPATIIITAHANYAVEAYKFNVVDYILKPFGRERFEKALSRARQRIGAPDQSAGISQPKSGHIEMLLKHLLQQHEYADRIAAPHNGRVLLIETERIEWIEAKGNTLLLHCGRENYEVRMALKTMQEQLDPRIFIRVHRSTLVNVRFVREIQPWFNGYHIVVMKGGQQLRMSRYQHDGMQQLIGATFRLRGSPLLQKEDLGSIASNPQR